jgi:hypothetical protein
MNFYTPKPDITLIFFKISYVENLILNLTSGSHLSGSPPLSLSRNQTLIRQLRTILINHSESSFNHNSINHSESYLQSHSPLIIHIE